MVLISLTVFLNHNNCSDLYLNEIQDFDLRDRKNQNEKPTQSVWIPNGIDVCNATGAQEKPEICSDGAGGSIIVWLDKRYGEYEVYSQRIDANGTGRWAFNGEQICNFTDIIWHYQICSDGAGGAIILIEVDQWNQNSNDLYAQRIDSNGNIQWGDNGVHIISSKGYYESIPLICSDGAGGAIISWQDDRNGFFDQCIYAQRLNSAGTKLWSSSGRALTSGDWWQQEYPSMCSDGAGGAIIAWTDYRFSNFDVFAQRMNSAGSKQWGNDGMVIHNTFDGIQRQSKICKDKSGGAVIVWKDKRDSGDEYYDLYAQRISSGGNKLWSSGGKLIHLGGSYMGTADYDQQICSDGGGGGIITWLEHFGSPREKDISAQHINSSGDVQWGANGKFICDVNENQYAPQICKDGYNGSYITWYDYRDPYGDIFAQHLNASGIESWGLDGELVCKVTNENQRYPKILATGAGAIITWEGLGSIGAQYISKYQKPIININSPKENDLFGSIAPYFNLQIISPFLDTTWYTIDAGLNNYTFIGFEGQINQNAWDLRPNGIVTIKFYANNTQNNISSNEVTVRKDYEPQIINNTNNFSIYIGSSGYIVSWHAVDISGNNESYWIERNQGKIDQGSWNNDTDIDYIEMDNTLMDGLYNYTCFVNDSSGSVNQSSIFITIINRIPQIYNNTNGFTVNVGFTGYILSWHAIDSDGNNQSYWIERNSGNIWSGSWNNDTDIIFMETETLASGLYNYTCFVNDTSGEINQSSIFIKINSHPYFSSLKTPLNNIYSPLAEYVFNCSWFDDDGTINMVKFEFNYYNYTVENNYSGEFTYSLHNLAANETGYNFKWHAMDNSGAWNSTIVQIFILQKNTTQLLILFNSTEDNSFNYFNPYINITIVNLNSTLGSLRLLVNNEFWQEVIGFSLTNVSLFVNGEYNITARLIDENYTGSAMKWLYIGDFTPPEIIFEVSHQYLNTTKPEYFHLGLIINCTAYDVAGVQWVYICHNISGNFANRSMTNIYNGNWTITLNIFNLNWSNRILFYFYANDTNGNIKKNDNDGDLFSVNIFDLQKPIASLYLTPSNESTIINKTTLINLAVSDGTGSGNCVVYYRINSSSWITYVIPFNLSNFTIGDYLIEYYAIDAAGNIGDINSILITLIDIQIGLIPPEIVIVTISSIVGGIGAVAFILYRKRSLGTKKNLKETKIPKHKEQKPT